VLDPQLHSCLKPSVASAQPDVGGRDQVDTAANTGGVNSTDDRFRTGHEAGEEALQKCSRFRY